MLLLTDREATGPGPATVVSAGGDRRPGRVVVVAVLAMVVTVAVLGSLGDGEEAADDPGPTSSTVSAGPTTASAVGTPGGRGEITAREGNLLGDEGAPVLLVNDGSLAAVDLGTGTVRHPGTPLPVNIDAPMLVREGAVVVTDRRGVLHTLSPDLSDEMAELGAARAVPSGVPDRVWLMTVDRTPGGGVAVEERTVGGERTSPAVALLPEVTPMAGVQSGLLLQTPAGIYLLPPGGERPHRVVGGQVLGAGGDTVARYDCDEQLSCRVHLTHVATGADVVPQLQGGTLSGGFVPRFMPGVAAFAPGGELAAVACACAAGEGVAVVDIATGDVVLEAPGLAEPRWSPDGRWLFGTSAGIVYVWPAAGGDLRPIDVALRGASLLAVIPAPAS